LTRAERNIAIVARRKDGRTLQALAQKFGLNAEEVQQIERRIASRVRGTPDIVGLKTGTRNSLLNAVGCSGHDIPALIRRTVVFGREALAKEPGIGKKALAEIDAWLEAQGAWWP
jgi:predicted transcriptional regulator